jgi:hypothetical protein
MVADSYQYFKFESAKLRFTTVLSLGDAEETVTELKHQQRAQSSCVEQNLMCVTALGVFTWAAHRSASSHFARDLSFVSLVINKKPT